MSGHRSGDDPIPRAGGPDRRPARAGDDPIPRGAALTPFGADNAGADSTHAAGAGKGHRTRGFYPGAVLGISYLGAAYTA